MQNEKTDLTKTYQTLLIIWAAMLFSQFLFLLVLFMVKRELFNFDLSQSLAGREPAMTIALAIAGIVTFAVSFIWRAKFIKRSIVEQKPGWVQSGMLVGIALSEATTLFGLMTAFLYDYPYFFLFIGLGILGILLHFPKRDDLMAASFKR